MPMMDPRMAMLAQLGGALMAAGAPSYDPGANRRGIGQAISQAPSTYLQAQQARMMAQMQELQRQALEGKSEDRKTENSRRDQAMRFLMGSPAGEAEAAGVMPAAGGLGTAPQPGAIANMAPNQQMGARLLAMAGHPEEVGKAMMAGQKRGGLKEIYDPNSPTGKRWVREDQAEGRPGYANPFTTYRVTNEDGSVEERVIPTAQLAALMNASKGAGATANNSGGVVLSQKAAKPTDSQLTSSLYATRMEEAEGIFAKVEQQGASAGGRILEALPGGNYLQSDEYQLFEQARRNFVNAVLRRESGAVISDEEFANADRQYFPAPGDSDAVIKQKRANRRTAIEGLKRAAGPAYKGQGGSPGTATPAEARKPVEGRMLGPGKKDFRLMGIKELNTINLNALSAEDLSALISELDRRGKRSP